MRIYVIIAICFICFNISLIGQNNITGKYYHEYANGKYYEEEYLEIADSVFYYIIDQSQRHVIMYHNDTLAKCTYKNVDDHFIELNSINDCSGILSTQSNIDMPNDSILIKFTMPYDIGDLCIGILTIGDADINDADIEFMYSEQRQTVTIPNGTTSIIFDIKPEYLQDFNPNGEYYGRIRFSVVGFFIEQDVNYVEIEIPFIDNSFFEEYCVKGEYARIEKDTITWKGERYKKKKRERSLSPEFQFKIK